MEYFVSGSRNYIRSLKNYEKKISTELNDIEQDILLAGINKLRREGKIRSTDVSEISDGLRTPDSESVTSDIFGVPDFVKEGEESVGDRISRSSYLSRVDENNSLANSARSGRKSVTKEPLEDRPIRYTSARPVAIGGVFCVRFLGSLSELTGIRISDLYSMLECLLFGGDCIASCDWSSFSVKDFLLATAT